MIDGMVLSMRVGALKSVHRVRGRLGPKRQRHQARFGRDDSRDSAPAVVMATGKMNRDDS